MISKSIKEDSSCFNSVICSSTNNNYLFSGSAGELLFIHPVLNFLIEKQDQGVDIPSWLADITFPIQINEKLQVGKDEIRYYYNYFLFLRSAGYFRNIDKRDLKEKTYTPEIVESFFANTRRIAFEVTEACNLECKYCGLGDLYRQDTPRTGKMLSFEVAKSLIDYFRNQQRLIRQTRIFRELEFSFYGGEPLLNFSHISRMVDYIESLEWKHRRISFHLTTNGLLLSKYMDFLVEKDFNIIVSLDGNRIQNQFRLHKNGEESYDTVVDGILRLKKKYPGYFQQRVRFNAVLHSKNSVKEANEFFECTFGKKPSFINLSPINIRPDRMEQFDQIAPKNENSSEPGLMEISAILYRYTNNNVDRYSHLLTDHKRKVFIDTATCNPFEQKIFCTARGLLLPCDKISHKFAFGKVEAGEIVLDYSEIASTYNRWFKQLSELCDRCYKGTKCSMCLFFTQFESPTPHCSQFCDRDTYRSLLEKVVSTLEAKPRYYKQLLND